MPTYADVIAAALSDAGIEYIYGVPGSFSSIELIEASAKRDIRYVLCSNESSAVVMASTYGVLRNRPGVCSTGLGPSAVAAVLGTVNALLEYAPCLILTDRYADAELRTLKRQRLDQNDLFQPIVKGTLTLTTDSATATLRHAIALTMAGRPGPVHIDLPFDVIQSEARRKRSWRRRTSHPTPCEWGLTTRTSRPSQAPSNRHNGRPSSWDSRSTGLASTRSAPLSRSPSS